MQRRILLRDGGPVSIKPKALETLLVLIERRDRVVDKDELMRRLWPDTIVEEANLSQNVFVARKALGEAPGEQRYIATVARKGYRFVGDVTEVAPDVAAGLPGDGHALVNRAGARRPWLVASLAAVLIAALAAAIWWRGRSPAPAEAPVRSIAVLPLRDVSPGPHERYFAEAMTDALIADLASISSLRVISRQSVQRFRDSPLSLREISRALGADAVIEGSVGLSQGRVRLTARLVQGETDRHLWSASYDKPAYDVLALEGELARAVASAVRARLTGREEASLTARGSVNPEAYDLYLRAHYSRERRGPEDVRQSIDYFKQSIAMDGTFAPAHGGLALSHCLTADTRPPSEVYRDVRTAAAQALVLDPEQPDALVALTQATVTGDRNWRDGLAQFDRIFQRYPNHATAVAWYGSLLSDLGRTQEALAERRRAIELDPWSLPANNSLGAILARTGQYDEALRHFRRALEIDPTYADARGWLGWTLVRMGRIPEGLRESEEAVRHSRNHGRLVARLAHVYAIAGRHADARRLLAELERRSTREPISPVWLAVVHAGLDEPDAAFLRLEQAYRQRAAPMARLRSEPLLSRLEDDPRFADLVRRLGLPWP